MRDFEPGSRHAGARLPKLLGHGVPLIGVAAIAAFNGSLPSLVVDSVSYYSPVFDSVSYYVSTFARGSYADDALQSLLRSGPQLYQSLTSVLISLMTLLLAGIPAAIYERIRGLKASTPVSLSIWLVAAALLSLPTFMSMLGGGDDFN
jgi:hypothetical protein